MQPEPPDVEEPPLRKRQQELEAHLTRLTAESGWRTFTLLDQLVYFPRKTRRFGTFVCDEKVAAVDLDEMTAILNRDLDNFQAAGAYGCLDHDHDFATEMLVIRNFAVEEPGVMCNGMWTPIGRNLRRYFKRVSLFCQLGVPKEDSAKGDEMPPGIEVPDSAPAKPETPEERAALKKV